MVEHPSLTTLPGGDLMAFDVARIRPRFDYKFMGWLLIGAMITVVVSSADRWRLATSLADLLLPLAGLIVGVLLARFGDRDRLMRRPLLHISSDRQWISRFSPGEPELYPVATLTHVVFGMIDYPIGTRAGAEIEAFALYLADAEGTPIPVVDGSRDRLRTYKLGQALAQTLGLPLIELGKGYEGDPVEDLPLARRS